MPRFHSFLLSLVALILVLNFHFQFHFCFTMPNIACILWQLCHPFVIKLNNANFPFTFTPSVTVLSLACQEAANWELLNFQQLSGKTTFVHHWQNLKVPFSASSIHYLAFQFVLPWWMIDTHQRILLLLPSSTVMVMISQNDCCDSMTFGEKSPKKEGCYATCCRPIVRGTLQRKELLSELIIHHTLLPPNALVTNHRWESHLSILEICHQPRFLLQQTVYFRQDWCSQKCLCILETYHLLALIFFLRHWEIYFCQE